MVTIDDDVIRMDYFLKRVKIADGDDAATIQQLVYEQIVKKRAPQCRFSATGHSTTGLSKKCQVM